jgi:glycosyltransferase involved in cell wall biosynthesis
MPGANWLATVYHGLPLQLYRPSFEPGSYLFFVGRLSPEKRPDSAIAIAKATGIPLKIAAKVDPVDRVYFETRIRPLLDHPLIEYLGEVDDARKSALLRAARALLFPVDWPEPFGLILIEALASGTPIVARRRGSVPEIVREGVTGLLGETDDDLVGAVSRCQTIDRRACRVDFEARFSVAAMTRRYVELYEQLVDERLSLRRPLRVAPRRSGSLPAPVDREALVEP